MVKLQFFPLDITYRIVGDKAQIMLFGRTIDNKQICVIDEKFEPYFYVITKNVESVKEKLSKIRIEGENNESYYVTKVEEAKKKYLNKDVSAIRVYTHLPRDVPVIRDTIKEWEMIESIHEYDLQFTKRYLVDKNIVPTTLVEFEGEEIAQKSRVPVFKAESINPIGEQSLKDLRILAFDIETYNPDGKTILPEKNPIIMLAVYGDNFKKVFTWKKFKKTNGDIQFVNSEAELIEKFKEAVATYKPDVITGYFSDGFDFPYLKTRAGKYKIKLDLGLDLSDIKIKSGMTKKAKITGIIHLDIFKFVMKIIGSSLETDSYSLNAVASELLGEEKKEVDIDTLAYVWDNKPKEIEKFCEYNLYDSILTYKLSKKMLPTLLELVKIVGLPIYDVNRMGFSQLVEGYLLKQAQTFNEIAPNKPHNEELMKRRGLTFKGAFVFEPKPGLYKNIVVYDYRSLYPSIISSHNISPGTLNCSCCEGEAEVPEGETSWFCKKVKGFVPTIIEDLIKRRMRIKEIIKKKEKEDIFLSARDHALKLLANSFYGYLGFFGARWYSMDSARAVTAWGRFYIKDVIAKSEKNGFMVLYSDTDSVFIALNENTKEDAEKFMEKINMSLPGIMELEYEGFYPSGIFVSAKVGMYGAKKKYALLSENGLLKIRGFEAVRRNWSTIAKEVQENVLNIILKEDDTIKALDYVKGVVSDIRKKKTPIKKLIINTQLQKDIKSYDSIGPHVAVAQKLINQGTKVSAGATISYVISQGNGKIRDRAKLPEEMKKYEYDPEYYINNQVIPAIERIFNVIGYKKEELLRTKEQKNLDRFFN